MKLNNLITITIPTRYGTDQLVLTAKSIYESAGAIKINFMIVADSNPLSKKVKNSLINLGVKVTENKELGSQYKKVNQMIRQVTTEYVITTQDDVIFHEDAIKEIIKVIRLNPRATLILPRVLSAKSKTIFQKVLERGVNIIYNTALKWNDGDNYLLANGRCMIFKTSFLKKIRIPSNVVNGDAYRYFANKLANGSIVHASKAIIYNKNPLYFKEQLNQYQRFQYSRTEIEHIIGKDLGNEYKIPKLAFLSSVKQEFIKHPILTILYLLLGVLERLLPVNKNIVSQTSWAIAKSTKIN